MLTFNEFYMLLTLIVNEHCTYYEKPHQSLCVEIVRDCVLDGETLDFCKANWKPECLEKEVM